MRIDGSCQCGAITFEGEADPERVWVCHCTDWGRFPAMKSRAELGRR